MANQKLTALSELSIPIGTDLTYVVDDPGGTPVSNKLTIQRLLGLARFAPTGRLSFESGAAVSGNIQSASVVYYIPYTGDVITLYDGTRWIEMVYSQTSLSMTMVNGAVYNVFAYDNSGTLALELGAWKNSTVTITIASPGVVSWSVHGLSDGDTIVLSTSGALPTGLTAGTTYYLVNKGTNNFQLSATKGGAAINTTGSQSGTHTAYVNGLSNDSLAGLGVRSLTYQDGVLVKDSATTRRWLGVVKASGTNTSDDYSGGVASQVGGRRLLWNAYNQVPRALGWFDGTDYWTYATNTWRQTNNAAGNKVEVVCGAVQPLDQTLILSVGSNTSTVGTATGWGSGLGLDTTTTPTGLYTEGYNGSGGVAANAVFSCAGRFTGLTGLGYHYVAGMEISSSATTIFYGDESGSCQSGATGFWNA